MFRHIEVNEPGVSEVKDKKGKCGTKSSSTGLWLTRPEMFAEYNCLFGTSKPTKGLDKPEHFCRWNIVTGRDLSFLHANDKSGRVFWFILEKMKDRHQVPDIPRYTDEDAVELARRCKDVMMNDTVKFSDLWETRIACKLVPLEEALFQRWSWGRIVCMGDSVHKWTPNIGQGGNSAIESAALIANILNRLAQGESAPSAKTIENGLKQFQLRRKPRVQAIFKASNDATRMEALKGPMENFTVRILLGIL
jgi:FAD dependent monooxygenase